MTIYYIRYIVYQKYSNILLILGVDWRWQCPMGRIVLPASSSIIKLELIYRLVYYSNYFRNGDDMYSWLVSKRCFSLCSGGLISSRRCFYALLGRYLSRGGSGDETLFAIEMEHCSCFGPDWDSGLAAWWRGSVCSWFASTWSLFWILVCFFIIMTMDPRSSWVGLGRSPRFGKKSKLIRTGVGVRGYISFFSFSFTRPELHGLQYSGTTCSALARRISFFNQNNRTWMIDLEQKI
jgi:hypothetical protein